MPSNLCVGERVYALNLHDFKTKVIAANIDIEKWVSLEQDEIQNCVNN